MPDREVRESILISQITRASRPYTEAETLAAGELWEMHKRAVFGFIRVRTNNEDSAEEILQETAVEVWKHLPKFDPLRGSFQSFAKCRAGFVILRYFRDKKKFDRLHILFTDLAAMFPAFEEEQEIEEILSCLSPFSPQDTPEKCGILAEIRGTLLCAVFNHEIPPHQAVAFGFSQILGWKAEEIVRDFSLRLLGELGWELEQDCVDINQLPEAQVSACFRQFRENLRRRLAEVLMEDRTRKTWRHLLQRIVGETLLREYYTDPDDPAQNIRQWYTSVCRHLVKEFTQEVTHATERF